MDTKTDATAQEFTQSQTTPPESTVTENEPVRAEIQDISAETTFSEMHVQQEEKRRPFPSNKTILFGVLLLAFCGSVAFQLKRAREPSTGLVTREEEREGEPETVFVKAQPEPPTTDESISALPTAPAAAESRPPRRAAGVRAPEVVSDEDQLLFNKETLLGLTAPAFVRPAREFEYPQSAAERWANKAGELMQVLSEEADEQAAEDFREFIMKELPKERDVPVCTDTLRTQVLEIRKQQLIRMAVDCFKCRRRREEAYVTMRLMEQYLRIIKDKEGQENIPTDLLQAMKFFDATNKKIVLEKEEAVLAQARMAYEHLLVKERTALEDLHYFLVEFSGHVASIEIFQHMDASTSDWKAKLPQLKDFGQAMANLDSIFSTEMFGQVPGISADLKIAKDAVFKDKNAAFMIFAKLADIVKERKGINRTFWVLHDPEIEKLTGPMVSKSRITVYQTMDKVETLKKELAENLKTRQTKIKVEWWLVLLL